MDRVDMERMIASIVRKMLNEYGGVERDDLMAQAWLVTTEKIGAYDKAKGASLSTYLYTQVEGELRHYIERVVLRGLHLGGYRTHVSTVPDQSHEESGDAKIMLEQMVSLETGIHRDVLLCMIGGKTPTETAKELKVSRQRIGQVLQGIRERYNGD